MQNTQVGERGVAYVVDAQGRVIAHPDMNVARFLPDVSSLPYVREAKAARSSGSARMARDVNGQDIVVMYAPVPGPAWTVFVELPVAEWDRK